MDPINWARGLSGALLEWAFGVKPLINDLNNAVGVLERLNDAAVQQRMITAVGRQMKQGPIENSYFWAADGSALRFGGTTSQYARQKWKYRALYSREVTEIKNLSALKHGQELLGLTLEQFVPTAWNLLPWSFLWDYFANIGEILEQTFTSLQDIKWVNRTLVNSSYVLATCQLDEAATKAAMTFAGSQRFVQANPGPPSVCFITKESFQRDFDAPSVQPLRFELPGSPQKWLNMAALLVQAGTIHPQAYRRKYGTNE